MDLVKVKDKKPYMIFNIDKEIEEIIGNNKRSLDKFMEEVTKLKTIGNHIGLIKICKLPAGGEEIPEYTIMESYCEYFKSCNLYKEGDAPVGCTCPYELHYVYRITQELFEELSIEVENQTVERMMMEDFITYNLLKYRAEKILSVTNMLVNSIEITKIGSNYRKEVNPIIATISQFDKLIDSIRKRLIADRESKLKFGLESAKVKTDQAKVKMLKDMDSKTKVNKNNRLGLIEDAEIVEEELEDLD